MEGREKSVMACGLHGDHEDENEIFVKATKTIGLKVERSDTISDIKAKFRDEEGISENLQEIFFAGNCLANNERLSDHDIQKHSTLYMVVSSKVGMQIFVKIPSIKKTITLDVQPWDTIKNIKVIIHDMEKFPAKQQRLFYAGTMLKDDETLASCNIRSTSTLHLTICPVNDLQIFVNTKDGKNISLNVKSWDTVEDVKVMIDSILGVPFYEQQLLYDEVELKDSSTLSEYEISQGDILHMNRLIQIFVRTLEGKTITLEVMNSNAANYLGTKIEKKLGVSLSRYHLVFSGRRLVGDRTLANYNVQKNSTISIAISISNFLRYKYVVTPVHSVLLLNLM